jgi:hypothetical protein
VSETTTTNINATLKMLSFIGSDDDSVTLESVRGLVDVANSVGRNFDATDDVVLEVTRTLGRVVHKLGFDLSVDAAIAGVLVSATAALVTNLGYVFFCLFSIPSFFFVCLS